MKRSIVFFLTVLLLAGVSGNVSADSKDVVARIGAREITNAELNEYLRAYPKNEKVDISQTTVKKEVLKSIVNMIVLSAKAREKGLDKTQEVERAMELAISNVLVTALLNNDVIKKIDVTDDDIKLYYSTKKDDFKAPETVKARHILLRVKRDASDEEKKQLREKAEGVLKRAKAGEDFVKLVTEFSEDASKSVGGDLGYFPKGKTVKPFEEAAFAMKPGEISGIVESRFGYHIIKVEDRRPAGLLPLEEVREKIKKNIFESRQSTHVREYLEQALKDAKAEIYPDKLDAGR
ncbi:MAG: peptidylprolyl isomerase [Thermodesulfovibrionales bacterium]